ncbi:MAG: hypothetical protein R6W72_06875 [Desulfurivibrionaceae bacterium]
MTSSPATPPRLSRLSDKPETTICKIRANPTSDKFDFISAFILKYLLREKIIREEGMMKQLLLLGIIAIFCLGFIVIRGDGSSARKTGDGYNLKYLKAAANYEYGPRGSINSPTGKELFPAYPATFARSYMYGQTTR